MISALPPLDPAVASAALAQLPPRLQKRAEKLAADADSWAITPATDGAVNVQLGQATVTLGDAVTCDCLLAPRCAHIGAVCVAAPVGKAADPEPAATEDSPSSSKPEVGAAWAKELPAPALVAEVVESASGVVASILAHGLGQLSIQHHAQLLASVQRARVCGLPRLERALTAVATASQTIRMGRPVGRMDATMAVLLLAYLCHLLARDPADRRAIGQARRAYETLDAQSGVGAGKFLPIYASPVVASSGFAGVTVVLATEQGNLYSVTKTPPGGAADVAGVWHGPIRLGDLHCSHAQLAQKTLMVTGGKASADGRIGSGKGVRAALGKQVTLDMLRRLPLADGLVFIEGTVTGIGMQAITLETADAQSEVTFDFSLAARKTELHSLVEACQRYLSNDVAIPCVCLVRDGQLLCLWPQDSSFALPDEFGGKIFPGLDRVPPPAFENKYAKMRRAEAAGSRSVVEIIDQWLARVVFGGEQSILRRHRELQQDAASLETMAAPHAAELLRGLMERTTAPLALGVYAHEFR